jgi:hypothetical protein
MKKFISKNTNFKIKNDLEKIMKRKLFGILRDLLGKIIIDKEKLSFAIFIKNIFEEDIDPYIQYKFLTILYKFELRDQLIQMINLHSEFYLFDNLLLLLTKLEEKKSFEGNNNQKDISKEDLRDIECKNNLF